MAEDVEYRVVEVSIVTDEELTKVINHWVRAGWTFDGFQFAMREASRRPAMAFALFVRSLPPARLIGETRGGEMVDGEPSLHDADDDVSDDGDAEPGPAPVRDRPPGGPTAPARPKKVRRSLQ